MPDSQALLRLLQLSSAALPVGAFSYSEGLETLVQQERITTVDDLRHWLTQELTYGAIALEAAMLVRAYNAAAQHDWETLARWNHWLSAVRETAELREQSWTMGRALVRLLVAIAPDIEPTIAACETPCNFAIAFGVAAAHWQIPKDEALLGYFHSWAGNLINAGVKLIPLGQTPGQALLLSLYPLMDEAQQRILSTPDDQLKTCGWGLAIASMEHETLYSRLFRS
jgi:urease accessory protein